MKSCTKVIQSIYFTIIDRENVLKNKFFFKNQYKNTRIQMQLPVASVHVVVVVRRLLAQVLRRAGGNCGRGRRLGAQRSRLRAVLGTIFDGCFARRFINAGTTSGGTRRRLVRRRRGHAAVGGRARPLT